MTLLGQDAIYKRLFPQSWLDCLGNKYITFTSDTTFGVTVEFNSIISSPNNNHYIEIDNFSISNDTRIWENANIFGIDKDYRYACPNGPSWRACPNRLSGRTCPNGPSWRVCPNPPQAERGFNTQEKNNEVYGEKNSYTAVPIAIGRQYDPRLGRRWNLDPMFNNYLSESPFLVFHCNPIYFTDVRGNDPPRGFLTHEGVNGNIIIPSNSEITYDENGKVSTFKIGEKIYGASYNGNGDFVGYFYKGGIEIEQYNNPDIDIYGKGLWKGRSENKILMRMEEYFEENVKIFIELTGCTVDQINIIQVVQLSDLAPDVLKTSRWENWVINSESFVGCVDGVKNSWDAKGNPTNKESNRGTPYYYPDIDVEPRPSFRGIIFKRINDSQKASEWDFNSQSGYIISYDHAGIQQFAKKCYFEVFVIGINFNGTGENIILGRFQWGWNYMGRSGNEIGATGEKTILMNPPVFDKTFDILNYEYPEFKLIY